MIAIYPYCRVFNTFYSQEEYTSSWTAQYVKKLRSSDVESYFPSLYFLVRNNTQWRVGEKTRNDIFPKV